MIASYKRPESIPNRAGFLLRVMLANGSWRDDEVTVGPDWCCKLRLTPIASVAGWVPR